MYSLLGLILILCAWALEFYEVGIHSYLRIDWKFISLYALGSGMLGYDALLGGDSAGMFLNFLIAGVALGTLGLLTAALREDLTSIDIPAEHLRWTL